MNIGYFPVMAGRLAGGVEVYEVAQLRALAEVDRENRYHVFCTDRRAVDTFGIDQANVRFHVLWPRWRPLAYSAGLPAALLKHRCAVLHSTYIPPLWSPIPSVYSLHDTSVFDRPAFYHLRHRAVLQWLQAHGVRSARRVICPSDTTVQLASRRFPGAARRLTRIYYGSGQRMRPMPTDEARRLMADRFGVDVPYAMYVGQLRTKHKNLLTLLDAFKICAGRLDEPVKLVLVGKRSWTTEDLDDAIARLGLQASVVLTGHISEEELRAAYSGAAMVVVPSRSEGFGFAATEAMACGAPVVAARATCLPEIVDDAGLLADPESAEDFADAMCRLFHDPELRADLSRRGLACAGAFSWHKAAEATLAVYEQAVRCDPDS